MTNIKHRPNVQELLAQQAAEAEAAWDAEESKVGEEIIAEEKAEAARGVVHPEGSLASAIAHLASVDPDGLVKLENAASGPAVIGAAIAAFRRLPRWQRQEMLSEHRAKIKKERQQAEIEAGTPEGLKSIAKLAAAEAKRARKLENKRRAKQIVIAKHEDMGNIPQQGDHGFDYDTMTPDQKKTADEGILDLMADLQVLRVYTEESGE